MPDQDFTSATPASPPSPQPGKSPWRMRGIAVVAGIVLLGVGVAVGTGATRMMISRHAQPLMPPVAVSAMADGTVVAVKGKVSDIFGNKFIVEDQTGKALVETGRAGMGGALVARDETVTVQGRFEDGFMHGSMIVHADGRTDLVGGPGGRGGRDEHDGPSGHGPKGWFHRS